MIPYSRPKRSDLYTLSWSKVLENHTLHSGTYLRLDFRRLPGPVLDPRGMSAGSSSRTAAGNRAYTYLYGPYMAYS